MFILLGIVKAWENVLVCQRDILWQEEGLFDICVSLGPPGIRYQGVRSRRCLLGSIPVKNKGEGEQE